MLSNFVTHSLTYAYRNAVQPMSRAASMINDTRHRQQSRLRRVREEPRPGKTLLPIMAVVLIAFLVIGLALPVLPLHVHRGLGFGTFIVGLVAGSQFAASLFSRVWAGQYADSRGAKRSVIAGLLAAGAAGFLYLLSLGFVVAPGISVAILLLGRALLGGAESFIITGAVAWGLGLVGLQSSGKVIAWIGMAMFAALALGAPLGTGLYAIGGFSFVALTTALVPLITLVLVIPVPPVEPHGGVRPRFMKVVGAVWLPGLGAALSSIGFGGIVAFSSLLAVGRNWSPVWLIFSIFAASLVLARFAFGHLPDRIGGARVALVCVLIEAAGFALVWLASSLIVATAGAVLVGSGYSLVYPGLGVEAVRRAPAQSPGLAMGAYTVCLDIALGFGSPALGLVAGWAGLGSVFLVSMLTALGSAGVTARLLASALHGREDQ